MQLNQQKIIILANVSDDRRTEGFVNIHAFNSKEKLQQALKKLAVFWALAVFAILIPVFHFVLVPLFFFLGFIFAFRSFKSEGKVINGEIQCPHCHSDVQINVCELHWPLTEICQKCARLVRMEMHE